MWPPIEVKCLRRLIGMRCSSVYDLSPKLKRAPQMPLLISLATIDAIKNMGNQCDGGLTYVHSTASIFITQSYWCSRSCCFSGCPRNILGIQGHKDSLNMLWFILQIWLTRSTLLAWPVHWLLMLKLTAYALLYSERDYLCCIRYV